MNWQSWYKTAKEFDFKSGGKVGWKNPIQNVDDYRKAKAELESIDQIQTNLYLKSINKEIEADIYLDISFALNDGLINLRSLVTSYEEDNEVS
jgi:hypothetical protein